MILKSLEETIKAGQALGKTLMPGQIVCLFGDLGAGKTCFVKGVVEGVSGLKKDQVNSPTFVYLNIYPGKIPVFHFDLYRLKDADEFLSMGFEEMLFSEGICCIEWPERILPLIPKEALMFKLEHFGEFRKLTPLKEIHEKN